MGYPWGKIFHRSTRVYDIPVGDTRGYTRGARVTRPTLVFTWKLAQEQAKKSKNFYLALCQAIAITTSADPCFGHCP